MNIKLKEVAIRVAKYREEFSSFEEELQDYFFSEYKKTHLSNNVKKKKEYKNYLGIDYLKEYSDLCEESEKKYQELFDWDYQEDWAKEQIYEILEDLFRDVSKLNMELKRKKFVEKKTDQFYRIQNTVDLQKLNKICKDF